jgi:DNA-binding IclR family transcriptional regulator
MERLKLEKCRSMDGIEEFFRLLEDGLRHSISDLALELGWEVSMTKKLAVFLQEHGLVRYLSSDDSVILDPELLSLMQET